MQSPTSWLYRLYAWACERLYHELAWSYDLVSHGVSFGRWSVWRRSALAYLPAPADSTEELQVVELGFGTGELLIEAAQRGLSILGVERSAAMIRQTQRKLCRRAGQVALIQAAGQQLPLASALADAILVTFPAAYILEPATLQACARVLRPHGRLIIVGLAVSIRPRWLGHWLPFFYGELAATTQRTIEQRFQAAGLTLTWQTLADGPFAVSIIIAQKANPEEVPA